MLQNWLENKPADRKLFTNFIQSYDLSLRIPETSIQEGQYRFIFQTLSVLK